MLSQPCIQVDKPSSVYCRDAMPMVKEDYTVPMLHIQHLRPKFEAQHQIHSSKVRCWERKPKKRVVLFDILFYKKRMNV
jgi:hypothetical protein